MELVTNTKLFHHVVNSCHGATTILLSFIKKNYTVLDRRELRCTGDLLNYISQTILLCTIFEETEHESALVDSFGELSYKQSQA